MCQTRFIEGKAMTDKMTREEAIAILTWERQRIIDETGSADEFWRQLENVLLNRLTAPPREPLSEWRIREMQAHECNSAD